MMHERERLIELMESAYEGKLKMSFKELAEYLLNNGVIALPCKTGDTVYWIENGETIKSGTAWQFSYESYLWLSIKVGKAKVVVLKCSLLYYTKEEAEGVLSKLKASKETVGQAH